MADLDTLTIRLDASDVTEQLLFLAARCEALEDRLQRLEATATGMERQLKIAAPYIAASVRATIFREIEKK